MLKQYIITLIKKHINLAKIHNCDELNESFDKLAEDILDAFGDHTSTK